MNMARTGMVDHPSEWRWSGYCEIQRPPQRYARIDRELLCGLLGLPGVDALAAWQRESVSNALEQDATDFKQRQSEWTESIAVGSRVYTEGVQALLGAAAMHRRVAEARARGRFVLCEESGPYMCDSDPGSDALSTGNALFWRLNS